MKPYYEDRSRKEQTWRARAVLDHFNERIRVDEYQGDICAMLRWAEREAADRQYTKLIIKARQEHVPLFLAQGYMLEALLPGYFQGSHGAFVTRYRSNERRNSPHWMEEEQILSSVSQTAVWQRKTVPAAYTIRKAAAADAPALAALYGRVFQVYPTPLNEADYVRKTMEEGTVYYLYEHNGMPVSAASAEVDERQGNAELTNCATDEGHRKYGLMKELLLCLEEELRQQGIYCAYTIARALSYGMNAAFAQLGYTYTGRLTHNCYIFDKLEDMNVWMKDVSRCR